MSDEFLDHGKEIVGATYMKASVLARETIIMIDSCGSGNRTSITVSRAEPRERDQLLSKLNSESSLPFCYLNRRIGPQRANQHGRDTYT